MLRLKSIKHHNAYLHVKCIEVIVAIPAQMVNSKSNVMANADIP